VVLQGSCGRIGARPPRPGRDVLTGEGGPQDLNRGFALLELAAAAGEPNALPLLQQRRQYVRPVRADVEAEKARWLAAHIAPRPAK
jgi:hypothetical protein